MKSSLLCLALLLATSCGTMTQTPSRTSLPPMTNTSELMDTSTDYNPTQDRTEQPVKSIGVTTPKSTTTTEASKTCPTCPTCLLALTMDHTRYVIGGLALGCLVLLMTTMALACKLCCLKRQQGDYQPCHADSHLANGKIGTEVIEPNETDVMMTEVFNEDETAAEEKERKEDNVSTGREKNSEGKEGASESVSDTIKSAANNEQKQAESSADEASKGPTASETTDVTDGTAGVAEEPANGSTEGTAATQGPGSEG